MPQPRALAIALAATGAASSLASAQIVITPIIVPGQPAPGSPTGLFASAQPPATQAYGRAAMLCSLTNTPNPGFDSQGIWQAGPGAPGVVTLVAIANSIVPGTGGRTLTSVTGNETQTRLGAVAFSGRFDPPFVSDAAILFSGGGGLQVAAQEGDPAPGIPGATFNEVGLGGSPEFALGDSGVLAFIAPLNGVPAPGNRALYAGDAAMRAYSVVARNGDPAPVPSAAPFSFITVPSVNGRGDVAFFSNLSGAPNSALFWKPAGGALQAVVSGGDPAPGFPAGSTFTFFAGQNSGPPAFNDSGVFAVAGGVGPSFPNPNGLWRGAPGALQMITNSNQPAPGAPAGTFFDNFSPLINRSGAVLFYANLRFGVGGAGVWIAPAGQAPRLLVLLGSQAPGMPAGTLMTSISNGGIGFNNRGEGLVNVSLNYAFGGTPANGIFAGRPGRLRKVVASGDSIEVSPGVFRMPISIQCWTYNGPDTGRQTSINDRGEVAFSCSFLGGGGGAFIARLPDPCPGDATGDDVIDFTDLNLVLTFFGMAVPAGTSGDLNGDGVVNFLDLNVVLTFFGGAC